LCGFGANETTSGPVPLPAPTPLAKWDAVAMKPIFLLALVSTLSACGTSTNDGGGSGANAGSSGASTGPGGRGSGGASAGSGGTSAGSGGVSAGSGGASAGAGSGPLACGSQTCGVSQYCVNPCCGGAAPGCINKPDGGACPTGTHPGCTFGGGQCAGIDCCQFDPCTPPPPYCSDKVPVGCLLEGRSCSLTCA